MRAHTRTRYSSTRRISRSQPHDRADAHYRLAQAYRRLDRLAEARRHVLYALEIAPRFRAALSLLLEIEG